MRQQSSDGIYNVITMVFVGLTLFVCIIVGLMLSKTVLPPLSFRPSTPTFPATKMIPSETPTPTASLTPLPSQTSIPTSTPRPSNTPQPTPTETFTPFPTDVPPPTLAPTEPVISTPDVSLTATPDLNQNIATPDLNQTQAATQAATEAVAGFPFKMQEGSPALLSNIDAQIGCQYQGIGGQVFGMNSEPLLNLQIQVTSPSATFPIMTTGSNPRFGESGWMVQMDVKPSNQVYTVQILSPTGVPLSDQIQIGFPGTCDQNLALINFVQTRPY